MKHTCHALGCRAACPPRMLMCRACWSTVSPATKREVYRTVTMRDMTGCDHTWAPWWRAAHTAIAEAARAAGRNPEEVDAWLAHEMKVADELEAAR